MFQSAVIQAELKDPWLKLTMVDALLQSGDHCQLILDKISVRFLPSIPMAEMADFCAERDILVASFIWPESYWLITHEALSAGLCFVASDIGAVSEPIKLVINDYRISPSDLKVLIKLLEQSASKHPLPLPVIAHPDCRLLLH